MKTVLKVLIPSLFLVLTGCRNIFVFLYTIPMPPSVVQVNKPFIALQLTLGMIMDSSSSRPSFPQEFRRDTVIFGICVPPGWHIDQVTYDVGDNSNPLYGALMSGSKSESAVLKQLTDTVLSRSLPYIAERAPDYDVPLQKALDTIRPQRRFVAFMGRQGVRFPAGTPYQSDPADAKKYYGKSFCIVSRMRVTANSEPGDYKTGFFVGLEGAKYLRPGPYDDTLSDSLLCYFQDSVPMKVIATPVTIVMPGVEGAPDLAASPNPMRSKGTLSYYLPGGMNGLSTQLALYDISGKVVFSQSFRGLPGWNKLAWSEIAKRGLPDGKYVVKLDVGGQVKTRPIVIVR
jgi:hypothetical protein